MFGYRFYGQIRKRDWNEQGSPLKARINARLSVYVAVARSNIKSLKSLDPDGKNSKRLLQETLALFLDAADACLLSVWRKLRICEELFSALLAGISHIAVSRGGQLLRVLLIRLKPLVLNACVQVTCIVHISSIYATVFCKKVIFWTHVVRIPSFICLSCTMR